MCVVKNENNKEIKRGIYNIHYITKEHFQDLLNQHKIKIMECYFASKKFIIINHNKYNFQLDKIKLREEISSKSSNSFVKCKKKLIISEEDNYIVLKSLFHSLIILSFGIQIIEYNTIKDYSSMNLYYNDILNINDWTILKEKYQPIYNQLKSKFKTICSKN